ncbi:hypothetical protein [Mesomycoplasma ovipneumoniae]|uniref:hypothetical protein n=1 Tax=Mesomycoplasma ovipneumoniae TaxID=29562 RepID=UPI00311B289E
MPRLQHNNTRNLWIQTGRGDIGGTHYNGAPWDILYVKNKEGSQQKPTLSKSNLLWDNWWQRWYAADFANDEHKSSWIISITNKDTGHPLLYDPLNYYAMLGPFKPPELPE